MAPASLGITAEQHHGCCYRRTNDQAPQIPEIHLNFPPSKKTTTHDAECFHFISCARIHRIVTKLT
jgi:hypothetical protein